MYCPNCCQSYCLKSLSPDPKSNIPLMLKCGHTMCESCIRNIVKFEEPIDCKICHREMKTKTTDPANLLQNKTEFYKLFPVNVNMLGELTLEMISEKPYVQDVKDDFFVDLQAIITDSNQPQGQCLECQANTSVMCQQCATVICEKCFTKSHKSFTVFKNHILQEIELKVIVPNNCEIHKDKSLDYYCKDCTKSVCMDCLMVGSEKSCKSHDVIPTFEMNKMLLNEVREICPQVDAIYRRLTKTAVDIGHLLHNMENDSGSSELKEVTATIEQHFSVLHAKIQSHKQEVLNIITRLKGIEMDSLVKAKNDVTMAIVESKKVIKKLKAALESDKNKSANLSTILEDAKNILSRPWCLTKDESNKDTLKVTVNDDLCLLISDFIQLEGNAKALYKLRATHELNGEDIPPPPSAPVLPPVLPKDVRFSNTEASNKQNQNQNASQTSVNPLKCSSSKTFSPELKKTPVQPVMPNAENKPLIPLREIKEDRSEQRRTYTSETVDGSYLHYASGAQVKARITHMIDPHHFFVQPASVERKFKAMLNELQENLREIVRDITVGGMYVANCNGSWMRCRVDSIGSDTNGRTYHVTCLDYGTTAAVKIADLRDSPTVFAVGSPRGRYPAPFAVRCRLANCKPKSDAWSASDTGLVRNMINNELVIIHIRRAGPTEPIDCDVITADGTSVAHALAFLGRATMPKPHLLYPEISGNTQKPKMVLSNNALNFKNYEDVHLTHVVTPDRFFVRTAYLQDDFIKLCDELTQEYDPSDITGSIYLPESGMVCVAYIKREDKLDHTGWARAIIKSLGAGSVTVFLPDIGNTLEVNWNRLRRIKEKFTALRGLATECHLAGVRPSHGEWQENSKILLEMHKCSSLKMCIDKKHNRKTVGAILFYEYSDETVCVNQEMVVNQLAEATGSINFASLNPNSKYIEQSDTQSSSNESSSKDKPPKSASSPKKNQNDFKAEQKEFVPIRVEAKIILCESPSLIYFTLVHQQKTFDEFFDDIQKFYSKPKTHRHSQWKVGDRCCAFCIQSQTWRRASILKLDGNTATVFYTDFAYTETIPMSNLRILHSDFEVIGDASIKCHLAGVIPGMGDEWPSLTKEFLRENIEAYSRVFITKVGHFKDKSMPVELWVYHTVQGSALEPDSSEWRCLNKEIIRQGLGVPDPSYQFEDATGAAANDDDSLKFLNLTGPVSDWLLKSPMRGARVMSPDGSPNWGMGSDVTNENALFVSDWLPAEPLKSKEFTGIPTYIDNDGVIYLHDVQQQDVLELIRDTLEIAFKEDDPKAQFCTWRVGEPCVARYYLDGSLYRGTILEVSEDQSSCLVQYVDYGNNEQCALSDLRKGMALHQIPIQAHKCYLSRIHPIKGNWETNVLDYIHKAIVEKKCLVKVAGDPIDGVTPINLKYDKLWINDHLVEFDMATFIDGSVPIVRKYTRVTPVSPVIPVERERVKKEQVYEVECDSELDYIVEEESNTSAPSELTLKMKMDDMKDIDSGTDGTIDKAPVVKFYPMQKEEFDCKVTVINETNSLELSVTLDEASRVRYEELFENVNNDGEDMPVLEGIFENQACIALFPEDNKWYRALVLEHSAIKKLVKVRYVDYGNIGIIPLSQTRDISEEWVKLPPILMKVNLTSSDNIEELTDLLEGSVHAKIVGYEDSIPRVELRNNEGVLVFNN